MAREIIYDKHCLLKHIAGAVKGLKETYSKISRDLYEKIEEMDNQEVAIVVGSLDTITKAIRKLDSIAIEIIEAKDIDAEQLLYIERELSLIRTEIERLMYEVKSLYEKYIDDKKKKESFILEVLEVLADLYKAEQDHTPEISFKIPK